MSGPRLQDEYLFLPLSLGIGEWLGKPDTNHLTGLGESYE